MMIWLRISNKINLKAYAIETAKYAVNSVQRLIPRLKT